MINTYVSDTGIKIPAVTTEQMIEVDRIAIEETGLNLFQMMENAGRNLAQCAMDFLHDKPNARILVCSGPGGNGGGGICAARHLANHGAQVYLCLSQPDSLGEVPLKQYQIFSSTAGCKIMSHNIENTEPDLILDALIGYSLKGSPKGTAQDLIKWMNAQHAPIVSLDVPSGLDSTDGSTPGMVVSARQTLTLALPKTGYNHTHIGDLLLADIGIPQAVYQKMNLPVSMPFDRRFVIPIKPLNE